MSKADESAATKAIEAAKPTLINQLTVYLAGCSLEDVRGPKNMNRMRREMLDIINSVVWPDQRPLVVDVLFKEFAVS
jgi:flagellar basal body-associated protein FliL